MEFIRDNVPEHESYADFLEELKYEIEKEIELSGWSDPDDMD